MPSITGANLIGRRESRRGTSTFTGFDPRQNRPGAAEFAEATVEDVTEAAALAATAFSAWRTARPRDRAAFLRRAAELLAAARERLVATADGETGLGAARLNGELDRTTGQLRLFAELLDEGSYVEAIISPADATATPPRPDVRRMLVPIGPVAVFTPSNFPLAFGVAGGDSASALAAGCPIVVKGHPSHPATSEMCARALIAAAQETGAPDGVCSLLQARDLQPARALVTAPELQAVAFTGSLAAGRAIADLAASRPVPIPVYAEMGSLNPVFVGAGALAARGDEIADGLAASVTLGTGQFCTKPGLVFVPDDESGRRFARMLADRVAARPAGIMLNASLCENLDRRADRTAALAGVERLTPVRVVDGLSREGAVLATTAAVFLATPELREEHFGPLSIVVFAAPEDMPSVAADLHGNLTATIHADDSDRAWAAPLADALAAGAGRIVWNGFPTGVAVTHAMQHGGPYPATTAPAHTSVGTAAIRRFLRPVAWQNAPQHMLPEALRDENPLRIQRSIDGRWTTEAIR
jgi:acyl-CoA reductase-like NAD-dependent aldehyde dehydrogenase